MISYLIRIWRKFLGFLAQKVIQKYKPFIIGITGTVGKTTTSHYIADFLERQFPGQTYISPFSYNGEFWLPLSILQQESPKRNIFLWLFVFAQGIWLLLWKKSTYPKYLVLEYGIDTPGEMQFMLNIARPDIGFLTNISPGHLEQFGTLEAYGKEKFLLLQSAQYPCYNGDDYGIRWVIEALGDGEYPFYGVRKKSWVVSAGKIKTSLEGTNFEITSESAVIQVEIPVIWGHTAYNLMPVFFVAQVLHIDPFSVSQIFSELHPQKGRGSLLAGINETSIIDGSYNGGFESLTAGIEFLNDLHFSGEKLLLIGDMRELGAHAAEYHIKIAQQIIESKIRNIYLVGEYMKQYVCPLLDEQNIAYNSFVSSRAAGRHLRQYLLTLEGKKVIYVKGSQNTLYLEEAIKEILLQISDTEKLCRQSSDWIAKKTLFFETIVADR